MIYAYPVLQPRGSQPELILLTAAGAPSLSAYLAQVSNVNPIYSQLRDTAWAEAQASGNLTPDPRLLANLDRVRSIPATGRFLVVDAGTSMLTLYENGAPIDSMKVITGTSELPTPLIASYMYYITYNPYWHAPDHLVRKTIAPNVLKLGLNYFKSHGYDVIEDWSSDKVVDPKSIDWKAAASGSLHLKIRQDPGPLNSMGILKFPFPNPEDIYLHDTRIIRSSLSRTATSAMAACVWKTRSVSDAGCLDPIRSRPARMRKSVSSCREARRSS